MKRIHAYIEKNRVTEVHERTSVLDGAQRTEHVLREDHVATVMDEDGRTLLSKVCSSADEADAFLASGECRNVCENWHGSDYEIKRENASKPSRQFKATLDAMRGKKQ